MEPTHTSQDVINRHFIRMAEGYRPIKKGKLTLFSSSQTGSGKDDRHPPIQLVTPVAQALEQAKSDLKRGSEQMDVYDHAIEQDAKRKKLSDERKARRRRSVKPKRKVGRQTRSKKTTKKGRGGKGAKKTPGRKSSKKTKGGKKLAKKGSGKKSTKKGRAKRSGSKK